MTLAANERFPIRTPPSVGLGRLPAPSIRGVGILTGWGDGLAPLEAARGEVVTGLITVPTPSLEGERFRRATRECLLAVAVVKGALRDAGVDEREMAGERTGVLYVSATAYAAANRAFLEDDSSATLHFPYTCPSAVPGEVTIELGIRGPYVHLMGGGTAALEGLWCAARWLAEGTADRVLVIAVEAVHEVWDLLGGARRLHGRPVLEGAAAVLLEPGGEGALAWASASSTRDRADVAIPAVLTAVLEGRVPRFLARCSTAPGLRRLETAALARCAEASPLGVGGLGEMFACGPLVGLAQARAFGGTCLLTATWRNDYGAMLWPLGGNGVGREG